MKILDILNSPWMIDIKYHQEMSMLYRSHMLGDKIDFKAFESAFDSEAKNENELNVQNGIAIINVTGPLTPQASFFSFFFRGTSMPDISRQLKIADESSDVKEKLYFMNTPGGAVEGAFELAEQTFESSKIKPIRTFTNGMIASAGYLLASATDEIIISSETNQIGSIGVISTKSDWTEYDKKMGIEYTEYVSGKYKNIGSPDRKRDDFEDKAIQGTVDYLATVFFEKVSKYRGLDIDFIDSLQASILIGKQAIDAGLVDGVSTFDKLIYSGVSSAEAMPSLKTLNITEEKMGDTITIANLESDNKDVYTAVKDQGKIEGVSEGMISERARIKGIYASALPGQESIAEECIDAGMSIGDSAQKMIADHKTKLKATSETLKTEAAAPVVIDEVVPVVQTKAPDKDVVKSGTPKEQFEASVELQKEFGDIETYEAFMKAEEAGQVRILKSEVT